MFPYELHCASGSRLQETTTVFLEPTKWRGNQLEFLWTLVLKMSLRDKSIRHPWHDFDRRPICADRRAYVEHMQDGCNVYKEGCMCEMSSRTNPVRKCLDGMPQSSFRLTTYLLPNPNPSHDGSGAWVKSSSPSRIKRSGRNSSGLSYASGSCAHALSAHMSALTDFDGEQHRLTKRLV